MPLAIFQPGELGVPPFEFIQNSLIRVIQSGYYAFFCSTASDRAPCRWYDGPYTLPGTD